MFLPRLERFAATARRRRARVAGGGGRAVGHRPRRQGARPLPRVRARRRRGRRARAGCSRSRRSSAGSRPRRSASEIVRMFNEQLARNAVTPAEVDLACALNKDGELGHERDRLVVPAALADRVPHAAILACLGSRDGRDRVLRALTSPSEDEVRFAQVYLRHRPLDDRTSCARSWREIARMSGGQAQMRALHALASQRLSDPESLDDAGAPVSRRRLGRRADRDRGACCCARSTAAIASPRARPNAAHAPAARCRGRGRDRRPHPPDADALSDRRQRRASCTFVQIHKRARAPRSVQYLPVVLP